VSERVAALNTWVGNCEKATALAAGGRRQGMAGRAEHLRDEEGQCAAKNGKCRG
jgi:hypothetical protein